MDLQTLKICTKCKVPKPYYDFNKDKYAREGYYPSCRSCNAHRRLNIHKKAAYDKEYRKTLGWKKAANQYKVSVEFFAEFI